MMSSTQIPVVILNYNGWDDTFATLKRMIPYVDEIWVVDNGSTHDRRGEIAGLSGRVRTLRHSQNLGWAGGYNAALAVVAAEGHHAAYLLNNDAVLEPGALEAVTRTLFAQRSLAAVGSVILSHEGRKVWFDGDYHSDKAACHLEAGPKPTRTLNGAGFAISFAAFDDVGPFYEDYFLYHEEADWFCRASRAGWSLLVERSSHVHHAREGSDKNCNALYYRLRNRFLASQRRISLGAEPERWSHALVKTIRGLKVVEKDARLAAAEAMIDGLRAQYGPRPISRSAGERALRGALGSAGKLGVHFDKLLRRGDPAKAPLPLLRS